MLPAMATPSQAVMGIPPSQLRMASPASVALTPSRTLQSVTRRQSAHGSRTTVPFSQVAGAASDGPPPAATMAATSTAITDATSRTRTGHPRSDAPRLPGNKVGHRGRGVGGGG